MPLVSQRALVEGLVAMIGGVGQMSDQTNGNLARGGKRKQRRRLHLDGQNAGIPVPLNLLGGFTVRGVGGPDGADAGGHSKRFEFLCQH